MINRFQWNSAKGSRYRCGPIGPLLDGFAALLSEQGYSRRAARRGGSPEAKSARELRFGQSWYPIWIVSRADVRLLAGAMAREMVHATGTATNDSILEAAGAEMPFKRAATLRSPAEAQRCNGTHTLEQRHTRSIRLDGLGQSRSPASRHFSTSAFACIHPLTICVYDYWE